MRRGESLTAAEARFFKEIRLVEISARRVTAREEQKPGLERRFMFGASTAVLRWRFHKARPRVDHFLRNRARRAPQALGTEGLAGV